MVSALQSRTVRRERVKSLFILMKWIERAQWSTARVPWHVGVDRNRWLPGTPAFGGCHCIVCTVLFHINTLQIDLSSDNNHAAISNNLFVRVTPICSPQWNWEHLLPLEWTDHSSVSSHTHLYRRADLRSKASRYWCLVTDEQTSSLCHRLTKKKYNKEI